MAVVQAIWAPRVGTSTVLTGWQYYSGSPGEFASGKYRYLAIFDGVDSIRRIEVPFDPAVDDVKLPPGTWRADFGLGRVVGDLKTGAFLTAEPSAGHYGGTNAILYFYPDTTSPSGYKMGKVWGLPTCSMVGSSACSSAETLVVVNNRWVTRFYFVHEGMIYIGVQETGVTGEKGVRFVPYGAVSSQCTDPRSWNKIKLVGTMAEKDDNSALVICSSTVSVPPYKTTTFIYSLDRPDLISGIIDGSYDNVVAPYTSAVTAVGSDSGSDQIYQYEPGVGFRSVGTFSWPGVSVRDWNVGGYYDPTPGNSKLGIVLQPIPNLGTSTPPWLELNLPL